MAHPNPTARRTPSRLAGDRETRALTATLGGIVRQARRARRMTQQQLADRVGISRPRIGEIERGLGQNAPLGTWIALGVALSRPLAVSFSREIGTVEPRDAVHLAVQERLLRLARLNGRDAALELPVGAGWQPRSIDVLQRDPLQRTIILNEIWNRFDDLGGGLRNHDLKVAAAATLALTAGGDGEPFRVAACWVMCATASNRALVARYPEVFRTRFPGSSRAWVECLERGAPPPAEPGVVWIEVANGRLFEVRHRRA